MKNKIVLIVFISCIILTLFSGLNAYAQLSGDQMMRRCSNGVADIMIAPFDIANHFEDVRYKEGMLTAMTYGMAKGVSGALTRAAFGVYQMVTFYVPEENSLQYDPQFDSAFIRFK